MNGLKGHKIIIFWAVNCLLIGLIICWELRHYQQSEADWRFALNNQNVGPIAEASRIALTELTIDQQVLDDILAKPLFIEGRHPIATAQQLGEFQAIKLTGLLLMPNTRIAMLEDQHKSIFHLQEGDYINGWLLIRVDSDKVTLIKNHETKRLFLSDYHSRASWEHLD